VDGEWLQSPEAVRGAVVGYFRRRVASSEWEYPKLVRLSKDENRGIIPPFSLEKIKRVVKESEENKILNLHSFNFIFLKKSFGIFWRIR
jgi:hypothetical protein